MSFLTTQFLYSQFLVKPTYPTKSFVGQTIIVTGSNVGLGKEAARHFARLSASKIILAVRNTQAGEAAKKESESSTQCDPAAIEVWSLDLASYDSVQGFAKRANELPRIDALVENAGVAKGKIDRAEGHELTITVNVISTFLLALLLLPKLESTAKRFGTQPHLTIVSSEVHAHTKFLEWKQSNTFAALDDASKECMGERYQTSKLLEVLIARTIAPKLANSGVVLNFLNPGFCHSELARDMAAEHPWAITPYFSPLSLDSVIGLCRASSRERLRLPQLRCPQCLEEGSRPGHRSLSNRRDPWWDVSEESRLSLSVLVLISN